MIFLEMSQNSRHRLLPLPPLSICPPQTSTSTGTCWCCCFSVELTGCCTVALFGFPFLEIVSEEERAGNLQCSVFPALSSAIPSQWANIWWRYRLCTPWKPFSGNALLVCSIGVCCCASLCLFPNCSPHHIIDIVAARPIHSAHYCLISHKMFALVKPSLSNYFYINMLIKQFFFSYELL